MNKKFIIIFIVLLLVIVPIAWYLISPIFRVVERHESSPLASGTPEMPMVHDMMESMDAGTKKEFEQQVEAMKNNVVAKDQTMPPKTELVAQGEFRPRAHDVKGHALLIKDDGHYVLRFEDFESINGPDLRIYLASELGVSDAVEISKIRATKGSVNRPTA